MRNPIRLSTSLLSALFTASATACPVCNTDTGVQVRSGLVDANFATTLLAITLPFIILSGVAAAIHFGVPRSKEHS